MSINYRISTRYDYVDIVHHLQTRIVLVNPCCLEALKNLFYRAESFVVVPILVRTEHLVMLQWCEPAACS